MDGILGFAIMFGVLMVVWIISFIITRSINKKKLNNFKNYIQQNLPQLNIDQDKFLFAKQKSKQVRPDIGLLINEEEKELIIIRDQPKIGISHKRYKFMELEKVESTNRIISRGLFPKTFSYEEALHLTFSDGMSYLFFLENISNKSGDDQGANVVRDIFRPWKKKLQSISQE